MGKLAYIYLSHVLERCYCIKTVNEQERMLFSDIASVINICLLAMALKDILTPPNILYACICNYMPLGKCYVNGTLF